MDVIPKEILQEKLFKHFSTSEVINKWQISVDERFDKSSAELYQKSSILSEENFIKLNREISERREKESIKRDDLTGSLSRGEFYKLMGILRELGHTKVQVTVMDMNYLKDYNLHLDEPTGGSYALRIIGLLGGKLADEMGGVFIRYGGDDFLFVQTIEDGEQGTDLGKLLEERLKNISKEEYFSRKIDGQVIDEFKSGEPLIMDPVLIDKLQKENGDLADILIPPSFIYENIIINPQKQIQVKNLPERDIYEFGNIASMVEKSLGQIKIMKEKEILNLQSINPSGVSKLSRRI